MMKLDGLIQSFEEIIGWPYASPGSNDRNGIDCSGAFVRAFRAQGASIYHGSNRIIRAHCRGAIQVTSDAQLESGMAVFKRREDGSESVDYKPGGRYYNPALVGNYYHIGLVASVEPLRIIHATTPVAKVDTGIKGASGTPWSWAAYLTDVDYTGVHDGGEVPQAGVSYAVTASNVRLRRAPGTDGEYLLIIPKGTRVPVFAARDGWAQTQFANQYGMHLGWASEDYLVYEDGRSEEEGPGDPEEGDAVTLTLDRETAQAVVTALLDAMYN